MKIRSTKPDHRQISDELLIGNVVHQVMSQGGNSLGSVMQRLSYSDGQLFTSLNNSLKLHAHEVAKSQTFIGKILSLFTNSVDPDWIKIDGMRLIQILDLLKLERLEALQASKMYYAEVDELRKLLEAADKVGGDFARPLDRQITKNAP